jgi:hypothetical protein
MSIINTELIRTLITQLNQAVEALKANPADATPKGNIGNLLSALKLENDKADQKQKELTKAVQKSDDHKAPEFWRKNLDYGERKASVKCADIRGEGVRKCPFGLPVTSACKSVGAAIYQMTPIEDLDETAAAKYEKANRVVFYYAKEGKQCPFADMIMDDKFNKVECNHGSNSEGVKSPPVTGSPLYPGVFNSIMLSGQYNSKPLGWYTDNSASRNMFYGLYSYTGSSNLEFVKNSQLKQLIKKLGG